MATPAEAAPVEPTSPPLGSPTHKDNKRSILPLTKQLWKPFTQRNTKIQDDGAPSSPPLSPVAFPKGAGVPLTPRPRKGSLPTASLTLDPRQESPRRPRACSSRDATATSPPKSAKSFVCVTCGKTFATRRQFNRHHAFAFLHKLAVHHEVERESDDDDDDAMAAVRRVMHIVHVESKFFWRLRRAAHVVVAENASNETAIALSLRSPTDDKAASPSNTTKMETIETLLLTTSQVHDVFGANNYLAKLVAAVEVGYRDVAAQTLGLVLPTELPNRLASHVLAPTETSMLACLLPEAMAAYVAASSRGRHSDTTVLKRPPPIATEEVVSSST
ncbi:Aste57867_10882 [Aphanomyces stellatus]|uniref:Aste57867_10882 protein n=1 Tax=Aphanomyces stellatus TaxID=120398 RepID=A0A485KRG6_9STRA|nr:hypothetical protein As57867_010842 [Aphanomyces stellatus]VFT87750.1 Aste57867_10882 [Aphanomyces stellatus]